MILDSRQKLIKQKLRQLALELQNQAQKNFFQKIFTSKKSLKSFYIHGDVGRGKSMLMKGFFKSLPKIPKIYFHFNSFMRQIHEALHDIRKEPKKFNDELIEALKRVVKENRVICFDEFQVLDIADAMLLSRIFSYLFGQNIVVIFTSNCAPLELYKNGLQREVFLQFVDEVLLKNCEILYLDSPIDYRSQYRQNLTKRYFISNAKNRAEVKKIIANLTEGQKSKSLKIKVWGREIKIKKTFSLVIARSEATRQSHEIEGKLTGLPRSLTLPRNDGGGFEKSVVYNKKIAIFNFNELCATELSASDYQAICQNFDLIFLLKLPTLKNQDVNEAKRFMLFIDEIYENKVALIILAKTKPEKIYVDGIGFEAFARTVSRLNEIKSDQYWQVSKII